MPRGRSSRQAKQASTAIGTDGISNVHREMIREAASASQYTERPLKRRRLGGNQASPRRDASSAMEQSAGAESADLTDDHEDFSEVDDDLFEDRGPPQTVYDDSESPSEADSDAEFNNVDWVNELEGSKEDTQAEDQKQIPTEGISLDLADVQQETSRRRATRRTRPGSAAERRFRVDLHKTHFCTLLIHLYLRNHQCNDTKLQSRLRSLLTKRHIDFLNPTSELSQFDQTNRFVKGLEELSTLWRGTFKVHGVGMRSSTWAASPQTLESRMSNTEPAVDKTVLLDAAMKKIGSRDTGAQLFCTLLRAAGVDTRLVFSLQTLPLTASVPVSATNTPHKQIVDLSVSSRQSPVSFFGSSDESDGDAEPAPSRVKRFGGRSKKAKQDLGKAPPTPKPRDIRTRDSPFPVVWIEAFNPAHQKWIPVDPLVTQTVNKPQKFEPPMSDSLNNMTYVIAMEEDGTARDVTRRYAKAYNAKTRRSRVESTDRGARWLRKTMKLFRSAPQDRNSIEDAELIKKEGEEPMPRNVQDFKDHPYYALERHLKRNEVIHPRREVGKLSVGKTADAIEPIFRRADVLQLKSAEKWYRAGRDVQPGAQPLKLVKRPRRFQRAYSDDEGEDEQMALYSAAQTDPYVPPPVIRGQIPKNQFKNLDLFVPSMIPAGGVWIRATDGVLAARTLGIDFAEAVTGFKFKGRQGTAITHGVIVASEHREAMEETVAALHWQTERAEAAKRTKAALKMWKRLWTGLQIRARVMEEHGAVEDDDGMQDAIDDAEYVEEKTAAQGGFLLDKDAGPIAQPTGAAGDARQEAAEEATKLALRDSAAVRKWFFEPTVTSPWDRPGLFTQSEPASITVDTTGADDLFGENGDKSQGGGFIPEDTGGGFIPEDTDGGFIPEDTGGGFIPDDTGGGFIVDETSRDAVESHPGGPTGRSTPPRREEMETKQAPSTVELASQVEMPKSVEQDVNDETAPPEQETTGKKDAGEKQEEEAKPAAKDDDSDSWVEPVDDSDDDLEPDWLADEVTL